MRRALLLGSTVLLLAAGCFRPAGRLEYVDYPSRAEGRTLQYGVYLPPPGTWDGTTPLPLVVLLHGASDDATAADRESVTGALDAAILAKEVPPFVMVTPQGDRGFWMNWHDGSHHYKDWVLDEVVPAMRERFPIIEGREGLHLMGVSMGGGGGMQMWLSEPDLFGSATILSAPILNEEQTREFLSGYMSDDGMDAVFGPVGSSTGVDPFEALATKEGLQGTALFLGAAEHDYGRIVDSNRAFHQYLMQNRVPHEFVIFEGHHLWTSWATVFPYALCVHLTDDCQMPAPRAALD